NGSEATLLGIELEYVRQLGNLPAPWDGLLIAANYTFTDSEATLPGRDTKVTLPGQSDHIGNVALGFDNGRLSMRLAVAYRSEFFEEVNDVEDPAFDRYQDNHVQVDFTSKFWVTDVVQVYFNAININDEPLYAYFDQTRFNSQYEEYGATYEAGFTLQF
ncbi:MAG TPA: TonB-dependent receptor, partial [Woeseiaceae bacterium]